MVSYDPTLFEGAAAHYRYGRPPYSPQLEAVLTEELELDGSGRLLDGGCGALEERGVVRHHRSMPAALV